MKQEKWVQNKNLMIKHHNILDDNLEVFTTFLAKIKLKLCLFLVLRSIQKQ